MKTIQKIVSLGIGLGFSVMATAQNALPLSDLSGFKSQTGGEPSAIWTIAESSSCNPYETKLKTTEGKGVMVNVGPSKLYQAADNILTLAQHADAHLSLDFMLPKGSNSGIYLMGRYEVQLFDSWGIKNIKAHDCGSIYERWDESRGLGKQGYEGHPPRQNVSKAPGLWQHLEVDFIAPKFDATGKKTQNARFVKVVLNGVIIHENIEMSGPTRGTFQDEVAKGPILIQGDHGPVAFKNFNLEPQDKAQVSMPNKINYTYYEGKFGSQVPDQLPSYGQISKGVCDKINYRLADKSQDFLLHFVGKIMIPETDTYGFAFHTRGPGELIIDGKSQGKSNGWNRQDSPTKEIKLEAGLHNFEVFYTKDFGWGGREMGLTIHRNGMKPVDLHDYKSLPNPEPVGEIYVKVEEEPTLQRSFVMHKGRKRTHAVNVGSQTGVHYTYDLNQATLLQVWKGDFLNTTEMWYERGEPQISSPRGNVLTLSGKSGLAYLQDTTVPFPDSLNDETDLVYKGYRPATPAFRYQYKKTGFQAVVIPTSQNEGGRIVEKLTIGYVFDKGTDFEKLYCKLAEGKEIVEVGQGLYAIDHQYFVQIPSDSELFIRTINEKQEILIKAKPDSMNGIRYALIW